MTALRNLFHLLILLCIHLLNTVQTMAATTHPTPLLPKAHFTADTTRPAQQTSRQAPKPMILPGTRLDTQFSTLPAQPATVRKAAPAWLRVKASGTPTYVVDGTVATAAQLKKLRQTDVVSVQVLNGTKAARLYGKNARNGLVMVTTKAGLEPKD